jgi:hypothetical protein
LKKKKKKDEKFGKTTGEMALNHNRPHGLMSDRIMMVMTTTMTNFERLHFNPSMP